MAGDMVAEGRRDALSNEHKDKPRRRLYGTCPVCRGLVRVTRGGHTVVHKVLGQVPRKRTAARQMIFQARARPHLQPSAPATGLVLSAETAMDSDHDMGPEWPSRRRARQYPRPGQPGIERRDFDHPW